MAFALGERMGPDRALNLMNEMLWNTAIVAGPVLLATLAVGLIVSVFQVATQIQEITLSYVPKMLAAMVLLIALGPWMIARLTGFARSLYLLIPSLAG
ncbi:flagellar biosynthesis protein FliQ [Tsuneonella sp. CC-YZS046]|uniref:flagellar biosynthesis protein FliQ n=1 Tax=Tsuneonella sp. CC-YZS046 TaxID=3042152 RepID=UPI002D780DB6|nr:flagellar biosynthesis protein FliQ [Tsuneonella sp. CC-YZS046]WRO65711.1 flagellar biosynthesis protein FliQ [Tsuneonella sp. CC-YZS046]